jgi:hypothetical protein
MISPEGYIKYIKTAARCSDCERPTKLRDIEFLRQSLEASALDLAGRPHRRPIGLGRLDKGKRPDGLDAMGMDPVNGTVCVAPVPLGLRLCQPIGRPALDRADRLPEDMPTGNSGKAKSQPAR